jgi:hypothetical protein
MSSYAVRVCALFLGLTTGLFSIPGHVAGQQPPPSYECFFAKGTIRTFENGVFSAKSAQPLSFVIGNIDLANQFANLVTPKGTGDLRIVRAIGANHFLEVVTEGFMNVTTIYETGNRANGFPAVHSRHLGILGMPIFSQYEGLCRVN